MSIIIGLIDTKNHVYLAADKRAIRSSGIIDDNFKKFLPLRQNLYFGMTGIAELGIMIYNKVTELPTFNEMAVQDIINAFDIQYKQMNLDSTILVAGKFENNEAFIWNKNTSGETRFIKRDKKDILYSINTNNNLDKFEPKFREEVIKSRGNLVAAIKNTIEYASTIDKTISKNFDIFQL